MQEFPRHPHASPRELPQLALQHTMLLKKSIQSDMLLVAFSEFPPQGLLFLKHPLQGLLLVFESNVLMMADGDQLEC
jgi:hypothetical protein